MPYSDPNITARVACDVVNKYGIRWTAFEIQQPRFILAEFNTHREISRLSASSRAIPLSKQIERVMNNPQPFCFIGKNQKGMQSVTEADDKLREYFINGWLDLRKEACQFAVDMESYGIHKQIAARALEPWLYVKTLGASTNWDNFFKLRAHKDAQPEFMVLAFRMLEAYLESQPVYVEDGWHGPFMDQMPAGCTEEEKKKICIARCARISYSNFNGEINKEDDIRLHDQLLESRHMSPFEFCVTPINNISSFQAGNIKGFLQYRKTITDECAYEVDLHGLMADKPNWV